MTEAAALPYHGVAAILHFPSRMAEVLVEFPEAVVGADGVRYHAHACGSPTADGTWQGWLEFVPIAGGAAIRSGRETTQPNRTDTAYWATGLTPVYLEGALRRAQYPRQAAQPRLDRPSFAEPAARASTAPAAPTRDAVLDPFAVYGNEGEGPLRDRLGALSAWHLVNIIDAYGLNGDSTAPLKGVSAHVLVERIVAAVRSTRSTSRRSAS